MEKWLFVHKWISSSCGSAGGTPRGGGGGGGGAAAARGEIVPSPWRSVRRSQVKSAKNSHRFDFYKNKIQLRAKEPVALGQGSLGGAVCLSLRRWKQVSRGTEGCGGGGGGGGGAEGLGAGGGGGEVKSRTV